MPSMTHSELKITHHAVVQHWTQSRFMTPIAWLASYQFESPYNSSIAQMYNHSNQSIIWPPTTNWNVWLIDLIMTSPCPQIICNSLVGSISPSCNIIHIGPNANLFPFRFRCKRRVTHAIITNYALYMRVDAKSTNNFFALGSIYNTSRSGF